MYNHPGYCTSVHHTGVFMNTLVPVLPDTERGGGRRVVLGSHAQRTVSPTMEKQLHEGGAVHRLLEREESVGAHLVRRERRHESQVRQDGAVLMREESVGGKRDVYMYIAP